MRERFKKIFERKTRKPAAKKEINSLCHSGTVFVFTAEYNGKKLHFYGGGDFKRYNPYNVDVTIALNDAEGFCSNIPLNNTRVKSEYDFIFLPVEDFEAPDYSKTQLLNLLDDITEYYQDRDIDVGIKCSGGHGRTGTILATYAGLLIQNTKWSRFILPFDPVKFVRKEYCDKAVESNTQLRYVERITGLQTEEEPARQFTTVVYSGSGYGANRAYGVSEDIYNAYFYGESQSQKDGKDEKDPLDKIWDSDYEEYYWGIDEKTGEVVKKDIESGKVLNVP